MRCPATGTRRLKSDPAHIPTSKIFRGMWKANRSGTHRTHPRRCSHRRRNRSMISGMMTAVETQAPSSEETVGPEPRTATPLAIAEPRNPAMNALRTGLSSQALLLPNETQEEYEATIEAWSDSLRPMNPAEGRLVARVADVDFRLQRLARIERGQVLAGLNEAVEKSEPALKRRTHQSVHETVVGLAEMVEQTDHSAAGGAVASLLPAVRHVVESVLALRLPSSSSTRLSVALDDFTLDEIVGKPARSWVKLGEAAREVERELGDVLRQIDEQVEGERERLLAEQVLADDKEAKRLHRHKVALQRELDQVLATFKVTRELTAQAANRPESPFCEPLTVNVRLVPMSLPAKR